MKNDPRSYDRNFYNCVKKPEKNSGLQRGLNPWPRDTGATLYQLSYEATDVGTLTLYINTFQHVDPYKLIQVTAIICDCTFYVIEHPWWCCQINLTTIFDKSLGKV